VAPDSDGPAEIVRHGVTGLLYPPGDSRAAADAVLRLLRDRELRDRLAAAGRADVARRFTVEGQLSGLVGALERVSAGFSRR
jgi:phosphatidylinositol alpha 1,6-mannosyltransferase